MRMCIICTDGVMIEKGNGQDDRYIPIPFLPYDYIRISWRNRVLNMLVNYKVITDKQRDEYKKIYSKGFNIHGSIKDTYADYEVKNRLCQYMIKAIISENNIVYYNLGKKEVVIRYKDHRNISQGKYQYKTEKINVYEFIARVIQHIDDVSMNTRYYGLYSNRIRNRRMKQGKKANIKSQNIKREELRISWQY